MIKSPYATSVTRAHMEGKPLRDCEPSMTNRKALERPARKALWEARNKG